MLPLTRVDVHDLDGAAGNRARAFGTSNSAADRSVGLNRFRAEVHDRTTVACGECKKHQCNN